VDTEEALRLFKENINKHEDQLFGIILYYEGICTMYSGQKEIIEANRKAFQNIIKRGEKAIREAKQLVQEVQSEPNKVKKLQMFRFPPISGHPMLDQVSERVRILVETYDRLFPGRPRGKPLTDNEHTLLMKEAASRY